MACGGKKSKGGKDSEETLKYLQQKYPEDLNEKLQMLLVVHQ